MASSITITIDGERLQVTEGVSIASAILMSGRTATRRSVTGEARGPLCGMGICFECRVTIDGTTHARSCTVLVREGMEVRTDA